MTAHGAPPSAAKVNQTIRDAALKFRVGVKEIRAKYGRRDVVRARWWVWSRLIAEGYGLNPVARAWGCDHTSIMYARDKSFGLPPTENAPPVVGEALSLWRGLVAV